MAFFFVWLLGVVALLLAGTAASGLLLLVYLYRTYTRPPSYTIHTKYLGQSELGPYYVSLKRKLADSYPTDQQGGLLSRHAPTGERYYDVVTNAHRALANYEMYLETGQPSYREGFLRCAESIVAHGERRANGAMVWEYHVQDYVAQETPWLSAMGQGQASMVMCRAYGETKEEKFLEVGLSACRPFQFEVSQGGVKSVDPYRGVFYEEYAYHEPGKQHHTLNGMMSALMGLHDVWKTSREAWVKDLFDTGIQTIRKNLPAYDYPFCSSYDLRQEHGQTLPIFQARYNSVHVAHLRILAAMTGDSYFTDVARRWEQNLRSRFNRLCLLAWYPLFKWNDLRKEVRLTGSVAAVLKNNLYRFWRRIAG